MITGNGACYFNGFNSTKKSTIRFAEFYLIRLSPRQTPSESYLLLYEMRYNHVSHQDGTGHINHDNNYGAVCQLLLSLTKVFFHNSHLSLSTHSTMRNTQSDV